MGVRGRGRGEHRGHNPLVLGKRSLYLCEKKLKRLCE